MSSDPASKMPVWADMLLCVWVVVVGVFYYGGFFSPRLAALTGVGAAVYGILLLGGVIACTLRFLRRGQ